MKKSFFKNFATSGGMIDRPSPAGRVFDIILNLIVLALALVCILPMWHVLMSSFSDGFSLLSHDGLVLLPVGKPTLDGYKLIFKDSSVISGYMNTIFYVVCTVGLGFVLNVLGGYVISRESKLQKFFSVFLMFPLMFSGGMIPTYMVMNQLGLVGSRWVIVFLEATMSMYIITSSIAFRSVPQSTVEAAVLDGAGHLTLMFRVMFPQCVGLFTVSILQTFVGSWNSWLTASIYVAGDRSKWPLQLIINEIVTQNSNFLNTANPNYSRYLIQFSVIVAATAPILIAFPFFQKKLEAGVITGAVKE